MENNINIMSWPNLPYGNGPGEWDTIKELLQSAANYDFASGQKMTINGTVCGNVANASSVTGNGNYSNTGIVNGIEWVGPTGPIHSTYTSQAFDCQWYTLASGTPPGCGVDPKNEPSDQLFVDMAIASNTAKALTPTQTFSGIDTNSTDVTINVVSGLNVINIPPDPYGTVEGKLEVRGNGDLIISGPDDAVVIFNVGADNEVNAVRNGMSILNGRSILTIGWVQAQNILFNVIGGDITINAGVVNGNILVRAGSDVKGKADIQGTSNIQGIVIGDGNHSSEFSLATNASICGGFPSIDIEKYVSPDNGVTWFDADAAPGPTIPQGTNPQFRFVVTNTGTTTLTNIQVNDTVYGLIGNLPSLAAGASYEWIITRPWQLGQHVNIATVIGDYEDQTYSDTDPAHYFGGIPSIDVEKYVSPDNGVTWFDADAAPGPTIPQGTDPQFKYVVTNDGAVNLIDVQVNDNVYGLIGTLPSLAPGASFEWIITRPWQLGQHVNIATATGVYDSQTYTDTDPAYYLGVVASIEVKKYVSPDNGVTWFDADVAPGPIIPQGTDPQFKYVVTNIGAVTLTNIQIDDNVYGLIGTLPSLAPGATFEWIIIRPWQLGLQENVATVTGDYDGQTYTDIDPAYYLGVIASIDVEKNVSPDSGVTWFDADVAPGPIILEGVDPQFKYIVTNNGAVTLTDVQVNDNVYGLIGTLPSLVPGASFEWIITRPWQVGQNANIATATGVYDNQTYTDSDPAHYFGVIASIDVEKNVSPDSGLTWFDADVAPGPTIIQGTNPQFRFRITNTGTVTLTNVQVNDNVYGLIGTLPSLTPGASFEWIITRPWQLGQHVNVSVATGFYNDQIYTATDPAHYLGSSAFMLIKYVSVDNGTTWVDANTSPGPLLPNGINPQFRFVVTNNGDIPITDITVTDNVYGLIGQLEILNPSESHEWIIIV